MSEPIRYPKDLLAEIAKRISELRTVTELIGSELSLLERYAAVAHMQREDLEEKVADMREDLRILEGGRGAHTTTRALHTTQGKEM